MKKWQSILLVVFLLTGGCFILPSARPTHPASIYETWLSKLNEGQSLTYHAAMLAAEVYNEIYDHTIKELKDPNLVAALSQKINEARQMYRKAQSWDLHVMPWPPEEPLCSWPRKMQQDELVFYPDHMVLLAPGLPVKIDYEGIGPSFEKSSSGIRGFRILTLRGKDVMRWEPLTGPMFCKPFDSFIVGDRVDTDVKDLILLIKLDSTPSEVKFNRGDGG